MYGQGKTRGRAALLGIRAATTQNTAAIEPSPALNGEFLWHYLLSQYEVLRGMGNLGHLSHLNLGYVKELLIPCPVGKGTNTDKNRPAPFAESCGNSNRNAIKN